MTLISERFSLDKPKLFSWSYTRYKRWRTCPRQYYHIDVKKDVVSGSYKAGEGDRLHAAFQRRVELNLPMPTGYNEFTDWGNELARIIHPEQKVFVEKEFALSRTNNPYEFRVTDWFGKDTWFRYKMDHLKLFPWVKKGGDKFAALCIDFKSGKPNTDIIQLALGAQVIFSNWSNVAKVRAEYWWTQTKTKTVEMFVKEDMKGLWDTLLPELDAMEKDKIFPAKKNGLCRDWCPVISCEHNGKYVKK